MRHALIPLLVALTLGGCARLQPRPEAPAVPEPVVPESPPAPARPAAAAPGPGLDGELLFNLLLGEVAGQRQQLDVAVQHYLTAAAEADDPRIAERALRIALYARNEEAALEAARRWVELAPENVDARQTLGLLALRAGIQDEAFEQFEILVTRLGGERAFQSITALLARDEDRGAALALMGRLAERYPELPEAHLAYSRLALHAGDPERALTEVEQALRLRPGWVQALVQRAQVRVKQGELDAAARELARAIERDPDRIELRVTYARVLLEQRDIEGARAQFRKVIELQPDNADAHYSLGLLALDRGEPKVAERHFRRLLALGQREQEAYYYLGRIAEMRDDPKAAIEWYDRVQQGDYLFDAQVRSARLRAGMGDLSSARRMLHELRLRNPHIAVRLYLVEGDLLVAAGQYRQAFDMYSTVLAELPDNSDIRYARALVAEKLGDIALAEQDLRAITEREPENAHAWNALGYTLADRTGRLQEALRYIRKALELAPEEPAIIDSMGWVQYRLGHLQEAEAWLRKAWEKSRDPEIAAHLGEVLWQAGKRDEARRVWNEGAKQGADNPVLRETRERFLK